MSDQGETPNAPQAPNPSSDGGAGQTITQPGLQPPPASAHAGNAGQGTRVEHPASGDRAVTEWLAANKVEAMNKLNAGDTKAMDQYREVLYAHARGDPMPAWFTRTESAPAARNEDGHIIDHRPPPGASEEQMNAIRTMVANRADLGDSRAAVTSIVEALQLPATEANVIADRVAEHVRLGGGINRQLSPEQLDAQMQNVRNQLGPNADETLLLAQKYLKKHDIESEWNATNLGTLALDSVIIQRLAQAAKRHGIK